MQLRPHQLEGIARATAAMEGGGGFAIFCEQRTGKTAIAVRIIRQLKPATVWVLCPKVAIPIWRLAFKRLEIDALVVNYDQIITRRKAWYKAAKAAEDLMVIADESHFLKTRGTARSGVSRHIAHHARYRLILTGTPIAQGLQDAWAQFDFVDPKIFGPYDDKVERDPRTKRIIRIIQEGFDSRYLKWGGFKNHDIVGYRNEEEFYQKFHAHSYRVTLREARKRAGYAPLKIHSVKIPVHLTESTRQIYDSILDDLIATVNQRKIKIKNVLSSVSKLQQVTGGFLIDSADGEKEILTVGNEKMTKLREVVRSFAPQTKFIVIARYIHEIETITNLLDSMGYRVNEVRGGIPYDGKFQADAIVMQIQAGMAVDMSHASTIIFYSTDYSYLNYEQSRFRTLSFDKKIARYFSLIGMDTIDEIIHQAVTRKKNLAKLVCDTYRKGNRT